MSWGFVALCAFLLLATVDSASGKAGDGSALIDFSAADLRAWRPINDGVMGGLSESRMVGTDEGARFEGHLSLENNGGFASLRAPLDGRRLSGADGLVLRVRGDGRRYQLRLRTDDGFDGIAYRAEFETSGEGWEIVHLPFDEFLPTFRGRILRGVEPLRPEAARQISLMIADKREGDFALEIAWLQTARVGL